MSKIGDWIIGMEEAHSSGKCESYCQPCKDENNLTEPQYDYEV